MTEILNSLARRQQQRYSAFCHPNAMNTGCQISFNPNCADRKLLTSKIRYVFIQSMRTHDNKQAKVAHRTAGDLSLRALNLLLLGSLLVLLILSQGAGSG